MENACLINRRTFITTSTALAAGICVCGLEGCFLFPSEGNTPKILPQSYEIHEHEKKLIIFMELAPELRNAGTAVKIIDSRLNDSIIIVNTGVKGFRALSIKCTHNGFEVEYKPDDNIFRCISVNHALFSCDGEVLSGPTEKTLAIYPVEVTNDKLMISI